MNLITWKQYPCIGREVQKKCKKKKKHALSITGGVWLIASYDTYKFCKQ